MANLKDVAKKADVAVSTVSAVINRSAPVSRATLERVNAAIAELGYVPNSTARSLRSGQSNLIGVIVPDITNPHFSNVARVIEDRCFAAGYMSVLFNTGEDAAREMRVLDMMRMQRVAGLVLMPTRSDSAHGQALMKRIHVPAVMLTSRVEGTQYDTIMLDNIRAAHMAMDYLLRLGHRDIAVIAGRPGVSAGDDRLEGCRRALAEHGLELSEEMIHWGNFCQEDAFRITQRILSSRPRPTAAFSMSNLMTVGVITALSSMGLSYPGDLSVIGIDDFEWASILKPGLSVVSQPINEMAEAAIDTLLEQVRGAATSDSRRLSFQPTLIVRDSCAPKRLETVSMAGPSIEKSR